jgi:soluble cytochrome b562
MAKKKWYSKKTLHSKVLELEKAKSALAKIKRTISNAKSARELTRAKSALAEIQRTVNATRLSTSTPPPSTAF